MTKLNRGIHSPQQDAVPGETLRHNFDKKESLKIKGIAICMLLFHHLFYSAQRIEAYGVVFHWLTQERVIAIATGARICVWVFAFLSAYGLSKQYMALGEHPAGKDCAAFVKKRWLSLMKPYWVVFAVTFVGLAILDKDPFGSFGGSYFNVLLNFFGVADFFGTPMPVAAWWYMCFAQILIFLLPLLFEACRKFGALTLVAAFFLVPFMGSGIQSQFGGSYLNYLFVVILGILFAQNGTMEKLAVKCKSRLLRFLEFAAIIGAIIGCVTINMRYAGTDPYKVTKLFMAAAAVLISLLAYKYFTNKAVEAVLAFLGKHSGNMFLLHAFTYTFWPHRVYWSHNVPVTFLTLLAVSLIGAMICQWLQKQIKPIKITKSAEKV